MNMIEKVARAMADQSEARVSGLHLLNKVEMSGEENFMILAKAAIAAMREPTTDVLDATMDWHNHVAMDENYPMARGVMRAAVDAALEGK